MSMRLPFHVWLAGAVIACLSLAVSFDDYWAMFIARVWCIAVAALGAHVLLARVGMLSFGQALFFGVGAYAGAFLVKAMDSGNLLLLLPAGFIAGGAAAYLVALLVFGQRAVPAATLALSTMTLGYVAERLVRGWEWTGGQNGLPGIPQMSLLGHELQQPWQMLAVAAVVLGLVLVAVTLLESSSWGSRLSALGHDEMRLRFFGVNVARDKQLIFAIAGGLAGLAGSLLAGVEGFVGPSSIGPVFSTTAGAVRVACRS